MEGGREGGREIQTDRQTDRHIIFSTLYIPGPQIVYSPSLNCGQFPGLILVKVVEGLV